MTFIKVDQAPTMTRLRLCKPYLVHPDTGQIFGYYQVSVKWADGTRKLFDSEEEAKAYIEKRPVNRAAVEAEIPAGFKDAQIIEDSYKIEDEPVEDKTEFDVILTDAGENRVAVIKQIRTITNLGLVESKNLTVELPSTLKTGISDVEAQEIKRQLEEVGAKVEVK